MKGTHKAVISLLCSGLTGERLALPEDFPLEKAFEILRRQSVVPLAYQGAVNCGISKDHKVMRTMMILCYQNLMRHEQQSRAIAGIFEAFENHAIPYLPVKGCNLKAIYPKPELRSMGDVDILIHPQDHARIRPVMEALGFKFCIENDHVFEWHSDALHVELHKSLVPPNDEDFYAYYGTGWSLAVKGSGYRYDLSAEDAYIFLFTHFARHYRWGGIGCRHVVDLFVYRRANPQLDMTYIRHELDKLHLGEFHTNVLNMLDCWFLGREPDTATELMTAFIFSGGNWGTMEAEMFSAEIKKAKKARKISNSRIKSVIHVLFPRIEELTYRYPVVRKCPALLPVIWVVRWLDILLLRPQKIRKRLNVLKTMDDAEILNRERALQAVGLDFYIVD